VEVPTSFETVGHIAHLNLREELLPFKHIIGQVWNQQQPLRFCRRGSWDYVALKRQCRPNLTPFLFFLLQVILDKNPRLQTVVNKVGRLAGRL